MYTREEDYNQRENIKDTKSIHQLSMNIHFVVEGHYQQFSLGPSCF